MLVVTQVKMSGSEKKTTLQSCKTTAEKCTKKVCCTCKVVFLLIKPTDFFFVCFRCRRCLPVHDLIFCLSKLQILTRASFLALAKSISYTFFYGKRKSFGNISTPQNQRSIFYIIFTSDICGVFLFIFIRLSFDYFLGLQRKI